MRGLCDHNLNPRVSRVSQVLRAFVFKATSQISKGSRDGLVHAAFLFRMMDLGVSENWGP